MPLPLVPLLLLWPALFVGIGVTATVTADITRQKTKRETLDAILAKIRKKRDALDEKGGNEGAVATLEKLLQSLAVSELPEDADEGMSFYGKGDLKVAEELRAIIKEVSKIIPDLFESLRNYEVAEAAKKKGPKKGPGDVSAKPTEKKDGKE